MLGIIDSSYNHQYDTPLDIIPASLLTQEEATIELVNTMPSPNYHRQQNN